ncbi:MAG TPA: hypothetical protein VE135_20395 [Pyrinomonadaceae bacterium]|nr:hypothetical protein [Pyrinomonadaceae bacterium]
MTSAEPCTAQLRTMQLSHAKLHDLAGRPALGLLSGNFDDDPESLYNSLGTYHQAVLLNRTAALADAGLNLANPNFIGFCRSDKPCIWLTDSFRLVRNAP